MFKVWFYYHRFDILLIVLLLFLLFGPLIERDIGGRVNLSHVLNGCIAVSAVYSARGTRRHIKTSLALVIASVALASSGIEVIREAGVALDIAVLALTGYGILKYILQVPAVTRRVIVAAICVYLLIGLTYARAYYLLFLAFDAPVLAHGPGFVSGMPEYVYFSITTMTTVGYGDIQPITPFTRSLAVTEAVLGQIFLVVMIGRLVGLNVAHERSSAA